MQEFIETVVISVAILGCALVAGIFYAFSTFVMSALARLTPEEGIRAMQAINVTVINPWFFAAFFGAAAACVLLGVGAAIGWTEMDSTWLYCGSALYLVGTILVTIVGNVPLNNRLERVEAGTPEATELWAFYLKRWTFWNHVRTVASLAAAAAFMMVYF
jgi:uncharacterized membrane protein